MQFSAAVIPAPHQPVRLQQLVEPEVAAGGAMLRVQYSEVCGTDVYLQQGRLEGVPYPLIPGHVAVGRLAKVRKPLVDIHGHSLAEGDTVTFLDVHRTCHACWYCLVAKASTRCPERRVYGITYGLHDGPSGGWSEYIYLQPGTRCIRVDPNLQRRFMAGGCALPTALHAVERAAIKPGDTVIVGQYTNHGTVEFNPHLDLNRKHLDLLGCWGSDFSHFYRGAEIICDPVRGRPWDRIETREFELDEAQQALDEVASGSLVKALIRP